ncbi:MAG TPA: hypothetical protein VMS64_14325 [Candidatus Methylomirabilis sp.]|nr:hypothetical protein [Candidatus Methylomirabilis sp.]
MSIAALARVTIACTMFALLGGADGHAAGADGDAGSRSDHTMLAQRGGRGFGGRGQPSPGIRTLVEGRVTGVDSAQNRISLAVGGARVEAEFPPAVVAGAKQGDRVFVALELIDTRLGAVAGAVISVDPASGAVALNTPQGPWTNTFSPAAIAGIKPGDPVIVKLSLVDLGAPIEPPPMLPGPSAPRGGNRP